MVARCSIDMGQFGDNYDENYDVVPAVAAVGSLIVYTSDLYFDVMSEALKFASESIIHWLHHLLLSFFHNAGGL
jgi:hypothetical protein